MKKFKRNIKACYFFIVIFIVCIYFSIYIFQGNSNRTKNVQTIEIGRTSNFNYNEDFNECITLDKVEKLTGITSKWEEGYTGQGVTVAVLDSGVYPHSDLTRPNNRIIAFKDFVNGEDSCYDDFGHGTYIAGIIAGNGTEYGGLYKGMAPNADIVAVKVLDKYGKGTSDSIINGINWVIENKNKYNIRVINLSLGIDGDMLSNSKLNLVAEKAVDSGIIVITSVGNNENDNSTVYFPAIDPKVIAVGSIDYDDEQGISKSKVSQFSCRSILDKNLTKPDFVALGNKIVSLQSDLKYNPRLNKTQTSNIGYKQDTGTSASAAIVSGIVAVLIQQYPNNNVDYIKLLLRNFSIKVDDDKIAQGNGYIYVRS